MPEPRPGSRPRPSATQLNRFIYLNASAMFSFITPVLLLVLVSLSSYSIARPAWMRPNAKSAPDARINWSRPEHAGRPQPGPYAPIQRDGTYSTHNYKHANKAAQAHRLTGSDGIRVRYPPPGLAHQANYKTPMPGLPPIGGVVVDHRLNTALAERNYKMPRPVVLTGLIRSGTAPKPTVGKPLETVNRLPSPAMLPAHEPINPIN